MLLRCYQLWDIKPKKEAFMASKKKPTKLVLLATVIAAGGFIYLNLGNMITLTAENIASGALGVAVDIGSIDVSLPDKKVTVTSITIANPPGYSNKHAITSEKILIGLNTASKELIDFKDIRVEGSVVNLEVNGKGSNLTDLKKLAEAKPQKESAASEQVRVIIQHMVIGASTLNPSITLLDKKLPSITVPPVNISGIGAGSKTGTDADKAIVRVLSQYITVLEREASRADMLEGMPTGDIEKTLEDVGNSIKSLF